MSTSQEDDDGESYQQAEHKEQGIRAQAAQGKAARPFRGARAGDGPDGTGAKVTGGAGIEVALLWHRTNGELTVSVTDAASGASFELPVSPDEALTAFHHPYAYAAVKGVAY
jgi:hypothetical protein